MCNLTIKAVPPSIGWYQVYLLLVNFYYSSTTSWSEELKREIVSVIWDTSSNRFLFQTKEFLLLLTCLCFFFFSVFNIFLPASNRSSDSSSIWALEFKRTPRDALVEGSETTDGSWLGVGFWLRLYNSGTKGSGWKNLCKRLDKIIRRWSFFIIKESSGWWHLISVIATNVGGKRLWSGNLGVISELQI